MGHGDLGKWRREMGREMGHGDQGEVETMRRDGGRAKDGTEQHNK
jgi:hypothetical protein